MIVAVFLVIGGLLSGISAFNNRTGTTDIVLASRKAEFFISTAQGAESAATLLGDRIPSSVTAVSDESVPDQRLVFSTTLGAVKDPGASMGDGTNL